MANAAFQMAIEFAPGGGAGKLLMKMAQYGVRFGKIGGRFVLTKAGKELTDYQLGKLVSSSVGKMTTSEAAEWIGRFCFAPSTLVHTENGLRAISSVKEGDRVWSYRFGVGDWSLQTVADATISTTHGTYTTVTFGQSRVESTGAHPYWVVRGIDLVGRPPCEEDATDWEDSFQSLDGRWVAAQDLRTGDVLYGRDLQQHLVTHVEVEKRTAEVCSLSIEGHANFAVGEDGALVHNGNCWTETIAKYTGKAIPAAIAHLRVHGHHIVMQTIAKTRSGKYIGWSQDILKRNGISLLDTAEKVRREAAKYSAGKAVLPNLCYAANGYESIHSTKYAYAVYIKLANAEARALPGQEKAAVLEVLAWMANEMENGRKFW